MVTLVKHAGAAADHRGDGCSFQSPQIDQDRTEDNIYEARQPETFHGHSRIAGATEYAVDDKQQDDGYAAREHDARKDCAFAYHVLAGAHEAQDVIGKIRSNETKHNGRQYGDDERLRSGVGSGLPVLLADPPRHDGSGTGTEPYSERINER